MDWDGFGDTLSSWWDLNLVCSHIVYRLLVCPCLIVSTISLTITLPSSHVLSAGFTPIDWDFSESRHQIWHVTPTWSLWAHSIRVPDLCSEENSRWPFIRCNIWVRSRNCDCLVTWFCYQLIAKPGNKTATVSWPDPYVVWSRCSIISFFLQMFSSVFLFRYVPLFGTPVR